MSDQLPPLSISAKRPRLPGVLAAALIIALAPVLPRPAAAEPIPETTAPEVAQDGATALRMAQAKGTRVEVLGARTTHSQTFVKPDGRFVTEEWLRPRWTRSASGEWVDVDPRLVRDASGSVTPRAATASMTFSGGGSDDPLALLRDGAHALGLRWPTALPEPVLAGNVATYPDVAPGIDLQVVANVDSFTTLIVLKSPKALQDPLAREVAFTTDLKGVQLRVHEETGAVEAVNQSNQVVFTGGTPMMWDSRNVVRGRSDQAPGQQPKPRRPGRATAQDQPGLQAGEQPSPGAPQPPELRPPFVEPKMAPLGARVAPGQLKLVPDLAMLEDPETVYPVYIDPTWIPITHARNSWSLLRKSFPSSSFYNPAVGSTSSTDATHGIVRAGYVVDDRTYTDRSIFNMKTSDVAFKQIHRAVFSLTQSWSWYGCGNSSPPVTELREVPSFNSSTNWNTSWNSTKSGWGTVLATSNRIHKYGYSCGPSLVEYDITNKVRTAAASGAASINIGLIARSESSGNWTRFRDDSKLMIEYNTAPNQPDQLKVANKDCATGSSRPYVTVNNPTFKARASDPDSAHQSLTTRFHYWKSNESRSDTVYVQGTSANPATVTSAATPALADKTVYKYQAQTGDGMSWTWSAVCEFKTSFTPPGAPSGVTSAGYPVYNPSNPGPGSGGPGIAANFTFSPPGSGLDELTGYAYTLDSGVAPADAKFAPKGGDNKATVSISPERDGLNTLRVWTKDLAGRFSTTYYTYQFLVRAGDGPAAYWPFDDSSARGADATGHTHTNNVLGFTSASYDTGRGGVGDALSLNGSSGFAATPGPVHRPHPDNPGTQVAVATDQSFTVSAWAKLDSSGGSTVRAVVAADASNTSTFILGYSGSLNRWVFQMAGSNVSSPTWTTVASNAAPTVGKWTHLAGTYDAATDALKLYVMGTAQSASATLSTPVNATGGVTVGRSKSGGANSGYFPGDIDDVRIYPYIPAASEFQAHARPLTPVITFPNGAEGIVGQTLQVQFDAGGDTNVTSFKYSVGTAALDQSVAASTPGGTAVVNLNPSSAGELQIFVVGYDGTLQSFQPAVGTATIDAPASLSGVVFTPEGDPGAGATVMLAPLGLSVVADSSGAFDFGSVTPGTYTLAAVFGLTVCGLSYATELTITTADTREIWLSPAHDRFGYYCAAEDSTSSPYVALNNPIGLTGDDAVTSISLPFSFPFYDQTYTTAWVDTNGMITFVDPGGSTRAGDTTIPSPAGPNALIAAYWSDLNVDGSASIHTGTDGATYLTIQWQNVRVKADPSARVNVQMTLYDFGYVAVTYDGLGTAAEQGSNAVVGIESAGGTIGVQAAYKQAVLSDATTIWFILAPDTGTITQANLTGVVLDAATGNPVAGAPVVLEQAQRTTTTAPNGTFSFANLEPSTYTVRTNVGTHCGRVDQEYVDLEVTTNVQLSIEPVADEYGYTCLAGARTLEPVSTQLSLSGDDNNQAITLPFAFTYYGEAHTEGYINTNGILMFGSQPFPWWATHEIPSVHYAPSGGIFPMWSDWYVDGSASVWTGTNGTAPNRTFVVEWRNIRHVDDSSARVTFQVQLAESSGAIGIAWSGINSASALEKGSKAVIGIQNMDGTIALPHSEYEQTVVDGEGVVYTPGSASLHVVSGTVTCNGTPVSGATVLLGDATDTTDANGEYEFTGVAAGPNAIIAQAASGDCAGAVARPVTAVRGEPQELDIQLQPVATAPGYTVTVGTGSIASTPNVVTLPGTDGGNDEYVSITPPFPITLYGTSYNQAWLDTNGVLMFVNRGYSDPEPFPLPHTSWTPDAAVYPFWADLVVDGAASVLTGTSGTAPNRTWTVEWTNVHAYNLWQRLTFQVTFHESTHEIVYNYAAVGASFVERGGTALIGIENATSTQAVQFSYLMPLVRSGRSITFTPVP